MTFRETRGDEVRHNFFTKQFDGVELTAKNGLTQHIDGITGATMSVRALTKVANYHFGLTIKPSYNNNKNNKNLIPLHD